MALNLIKLLLLDALDLLSLVVDFLSGLLAFLEVVKSMLLADIVILADLRLEGGLVGLERFNSLLSKPLFVFFLLRLFSLMLGIIP